MSLKTVADDIRFLVLVHFLTCNIHSEIGKTAPALLGKKSNCISPDNVYILLYFFQLSLFYYSFFYLQSKYTIYIYL